MPWLVGFLSAIFLKLFEWLSAKLAFNVAFGLAIAATVATAIAAFKIAMAAIWSQLPLVVPQVILNGLSAFMPSNFGTCIALIITVDVIRTSFDYWRMAAGLVLGGTQK